MNNVHMALRTANRQPIVIFPDGTWAVIIPVASTEEAVPEVGEFGSFIRQERARLGLSQEALAKTAEITQAQLSKIETNKVKPHATTMVSIINALHTLADKESKSTPD